MEEFEVKSCFGSAYSGKRVLVTGHTGFKGSWLCEWLLQLGAEVTGFALPSPTTPALFEQLGLAPRLRHVIGDIRDIVAVRRVFDDANPDFVFHLAAQPLVRLSYYEPVETYATNVMGTVHVLDVLRTRHKPCVGVMITTDKCYENREWVHSYREEDPMGGHDPYSSSKGAAELAIAAYRRSFFGNTDSLIRVVSARAGNVVGGGDWALDRIVPDCIRALQSHQPIPVRNKIATRPWQHVLEPLSGYLWLAACLSNPRLGMASTALSDVQLSAFNVQLSSAFNFGPALASNRTVAQLVVEILKHWPGEWQDKSDPRAVHEAKLLNLATDKAHHLLNWQPVWDFGETIHNTISWYRTAVQPSTDIAHLTREQIGSYVAVAARRGLAWTQ